MKNLKQVLIALIGLALMLGPASQAVAHAMGISELQGVGVVGAVAFGLHFLQKPAQTPHMHVAGVEVEMWVNYIIQRFWKNNGFLQNAYSDDQYIVNGKIVHIPQPGTVPTTVKNRSSFPATAVRRADNDVLYALDHYSTDPTHIFEAEKIECSYDKLDSVYGDHAGKIAQDVADDMLIKWLTGIPAGSMIKTTGAAAAATLPNTTGTRKVLIHDDLRRTNLLFNKQDVPVEDRFALLDADMADQLFTSLSNTQYRDFSQYADAKTGIIGKLYNFNIFTRSSVAAAATADDSINAWGATGLASDNAVSICWQKNAVTRAIGETKFFENTDRAEYYGDLYSAFIRAGGRRRRADNKGIAAIIQTAVS